MKIDSIKNGIVLDHIKAGKSMQIYRDLGLDDLDCSVAIIKNVPSNKMGTMISTANTRIRVFLMLSAYPNLPILPILLIL